MRLRATALRLLTGFVGLVAASVMPGCSSSPSGTTGAGGSVVLTLGQATDTVPEGLSTDITGTVLRKGGFTGDVGINVLNLPTGVTYMLTTAPVGGGATAVIHLMVSNLTAVGSYALTIQAGGVGIDTYNAPFQLVVAAATPPSYTFTFSASSVLVAPGGSNVVTATFNRINFTGSIAMSFDSLPAGVTATFDPDPVTGNTVSVTFNADAGALTGSTKLIARGMVAGLQDDTTHITLTVPGTDLHAMTRLPVRSRH